MSGKFLNQLMRKFTAMIALHHTRCNMACGKVADGVANQELIFG